MRTANAPAPPPAFRRLAAPSMASIEPSRRPPNAPLRRLLAFLCKLRLVNLRLLWVWALPFLLTLLGGTTGCSTVGVNVVVERPAAINLSRYNRLAIGRFSGLEARVERIGHQTNTVGIRNKQPLWVDLLSASGAILGALSQGPSAGVGGWRGQATDGSDIAQFLHRVLTDRRRFVLVDSSRLEAIQKTMAHPSNTVLAAGAVRAHSVKDTITRTESTDRDGKAHSYNTRNVSVRYEVDMQLVDFDTGEELLSRSYNCSEREGTSATDREPPSIDPMALLKRCKESAALKFANALTPHYAVVRVYFRTDNKLPQMREGIQCAKAAKWPCAVRIFRDVTSLLKDQEPETKAKAWWNLGLALEYSLNFEEAKKAIDKAIAFYPENDYLLELSNIDRLAKDKARLEQETYKPPAPLEHTRDQPQSP